MTTTLPAPAGTKAYAAPKAGWIVRVTLPIKIALGTTLVVLLALIVIGWFALKSFKASLSDVLIAQQQALAAQIASDLDQKLWMRQRALAASATMVKPTDVASADAAQRYLDANTSLQELFDRSTFLFSTSGKIVAEHPYLPDRRGQDFSWREYFQRTVHERRSVVSAPFRTTKADANVVAMITAPVFDEQNKLIAIVAGSLGLSRPGLLRSIGSTVIGKTGYLYLLTQDGRLIMGPDPQRLMERAFAPGQNPLFERALAGFEGTGISIEANGKQSLTTFKHLASTGWIVAVVHPEQEAFASFNALIERLLSALPCACLIVLYMVWLVTRGLVTKMDRLVVQLQATNETIETQKTLLAKQANDSFQFFQEASHDFRQRLHAMQLLLHAVQKSDASESRILLSKMLYAVFDLQGYVRDFLEFARLKMVSVEPVIGTVCLQDIFQKLELGFEDIALDRHVQLVFRATDIRLRSDEKLLLRILENLISNACKFSRGKVLVAARKSKESIAIEVWDNGPGIPEKDRDLIFKSYYQSTPCRVKDDGVGLGLAIVMRLTTCLQYDVKVCSREGSLTAVRIIIPNSATA